MELLLGGVPYRVVTDAPRSELEKFAGLVNDRIAKLGAKAQRTATPAQLLAVAALNLAEDVTKLETALEALRVKTTAIAERGLARIDTIETSNNT